MKKIFAGLGAAGLIVGLSAVPAQAAPDCNWGQLTSSSIAGGFDQGGHASDPSDDGKGPEARVGLANVVEKGNLAATCSLLGG